jgi:hypothetical protein
LSRSKYVGKKDVRQEMLLNSSFTHDSYLPH